MAQQTTSQRKSRRPFYTALAVVAAAGLTYAAVGRSGAGAGSVNAASGGTAAKKTNAPRNAADLNGDGHPDEVFTSTTGTVIQEGDPYVGVVYGSDKGPDPDTRALFSEKDLKLGGTEETGELELDETEPPATGDLDEDGHPDLVASGEASVVWGGAKGPQKDSPVSRIKKPKESDDDSYPSYRKQPVTGDFDGDGHVDLATVRGDLEAKVVVLHGPFTRDGKPARTSETPNPLPKSGKGYIDTISTGDANGDKATDLVVQRDVDDDRATSVLVTGGAETDTGLSRKTRRLPKGDKVVFGDFDGDKRRDTAVGDDRHPTGESGETDQYPGRVTVYYGKAPGTAHRIKGGKVGDGFGSGLSVGDVDGDRRDDLAVELGRTTAPVSHGPVQVLHGSDEGLGSKPWRSTNRGTSGEDPKNEQAAQLYHAEDVDSDGKDEFGLVNPLIDSKRNFWYTDGTEEDDAKFSTTKFKP